MTADPQTLERLLEALRRTIGADRIRIGFNERVSYCTDYYWVPRALLAHGVLPTLPDLVVHPANVEEVAAVLRIANTHRIPVVPWGGGSGTQGGAVPIHGGIVLDLKRLDRVLEIDDRSLVVRAQAGIVCQHLEWTLNAHGMTLAHYPASMHCATLGGCLACRGSGVLSTKYGKIEDMVLSLEVVLPTGQVVRTPPVRSHACGPDLNQLFVGSEGTLGVITEATLRCDPIPPARLFGGFLFPTLSAGLEAGREIMVRRLSPAVIRLYDPESTRSVLRRVLGLDAEGAAMILMFDGDPELAALGMRKAKGICSGTGGEDLGAELGHHWWEHRFDFYYPTLTFDLPQMFGTTDTLATFSNIERIYWARKRAIEETFARWHVRYLAHFSHWYPWGAMLYDRFVIDQPPEDLGAALELHDRIWEVAVHIALAYGGVLNEHHGIGLKLGRFMPLQYGPAFDVLQAIKSALDPAGIMNPGKQGFASGMGRDA